MMRAMRSGGLAVLCALSMALAACGGGGGGCSGVLLGGLGSSACGSASSSGSGSSSTGNQAPTAMAVAPNPVTVGLTITLDGSTSSDPNRDLLTFRWSVVSNPTGSTSTLNGTDSPKPTFSPDLPGTYVFGLVVSDGQLPSAMAYTTVNAGVANVAPLAIVGPDQQVVIGDTVTLDGTSSFDANRDPISYRWAFVSRPASSLAFLANAGSARPRFIADLAGAYVVALVVSDGILESRPQYVTVNASSANVAPVAATGANQQVRPATTVTLDGTASSDRNGDPLSYLWSLVSRPGGSTATLSSRTAARPTFVADVAGLYVASLQVYDGKSYSESVVTTITADTGNAPPLAKVGPTQNVRVSAPVLLDGTQSTDPDQDPLTYQWSVLSAPDGSTARISGERAPIASFTPSIAGVYVFSLVVSDERLKSAPAYLTVIATGDNVPPVAVPGADRSVPTSTTVVLDGTGSNDPDGDRNSLTYTWSLVSWPGGTAPTINGNQTPRPAITPDRNGTYVISLVVKDAKGASSQPSNVVITADSGPLAPVANAGPAQTVKLGAPVTLDASASTDANGDSLTFLWSIVYTPPNLGDTGPDDLLPPSIRTSPKPTIVPTVAGIYVFQVVVTDSTGRQGSATVSVKIDP